ncbi:hypothetical protein [Actinoplanes xinjiangensis]|uniref:hypothetical protein n=1 Tax=Actinoplanes xinjiangensis TaxID=512350 RepID=UPI003436C3D6
MTGPSEQSVRGSRIQSGSGHAIGNMRDLYQETTNNYEINNHIYERHSLETTCAMLLTDDPKAAYRQFSRLDEPEYRRLVLRILPEWRTVQILTVMAQREDGLQRCAEHLGPMDSPHALPILRQLDLPVRAGIVVRVGPGQAARLLVDLGQEKAPAGGRSGTLAPGVAGAAQLLSEMAAVDPAPARTVVLLPDVRDHAPAWLEVMDPERVAHLLAPVDVDAVGRLLDGMRPEAAAAVIVEGPAHRWLNALRTPTASGVLGTLAATRPKGVAKYLAGLAPARAATTLLAMGHVPDHRAAVLRLLDSPRVIAILAEMHDRDPAVARELLDVEPEWRRTAGTWPGFAALVVVAQTRMAGDPVTESGGRWWRLRRAMAAWTPDLRDRRIRDAKVAAATAAVATVLLSVVPAAMAGPDTTTPAASTTPSPVVSPPGRSLLLPADLPLLANRAYWSAEECPRWSQQVDVTADQPTVVRLVCAVRANKPATSLAYLQYPPGSIQFKNRPTERHPVREDEVGATVHRVLTTGTPRWTGPDGRRGTYLDYLPDEHMSAIWLQEEGSTPTAMIIFGPDPADMSDEALVALFTSLKEVLVRHGYHLDRP